MRSAPFLTLLVAGLATSAWSETRANGMTPIPERVAENPAPPVGEVPEELLARIRDDLAARTAGVAAAFELVRAESVTWSDGSLGCPRPDRLYTQALVPGYWVVFRYQGQEFDYRCGRHGHCQLCESSPRSPACGPEAQSRAR